MRNQPCNQSRKKNIRNVWIASLVIFSCILCCSLPLMATLLGYASLLAFATHEEVLGFFISATALWMIFRRYKNSGASACASNCGCKHQKPSGE